MASLPIYLLTTSGKAAILLLMCKAIEKLTRDYYLSYSSSSSSPAVTVVPDRVSSTGDALDNKGSLTEEFQTPGLEDSNKGNGNEDDDFKEDNVEGDSLVREARPWKILYPQRPNAPENQEQKSASPESSQYYLQSGGCKFTKARRYIPSWKKPVVSLAPPVDFNFLGLPIRPGEKECLYYMHTGSCKYGPNCKFHHPDPTAVEGDDTNCKFHHLDPTAVEGDDIPSGSVSLHPSGVWQPTSTSWSSPPNETALDLDGSKSYVPMMLPPQRVHPNPEGNGYQAPAYPPERSVHSPPALVMNNPTNRTDFFRHGQQHMLDEFPERPGQPECSYFMRTGDCKYRLACKYNHPKNHVPKSSTSIPSPMGDAEAKQQQDIHNKQRSACKNPMDSGRHDRYGSLGSGGGGPPSRADEVDNWAVGKKAPPTAKPMGLGLGFRDSAFDMHRRGRAPLHAVNEPPKATRPSPFGAARPREEVLAEKGLNWRKLDSVIESYEMTSWPTSSQSSNPLSVQSNSAESPAPQVLGAPPHDRYGDHECPPLVLDPPKGDGVLNGPPKATRPSPFGAARPREEVLAEKGLDWRKLDSVIESHETTSQPTSSQSSSPLSVQSNSPESPAPQVLGAPLHDGDCECPPLVLDPPKGYGVVNEPPRAARPSPFGAARPREEVLGEKGLSWRKLDSESYKTRSQPASSQSSSPSSAQLSSVESPVPQVLKAAPKPRPKVNPFGDARPREVLLEEQGKDWRKIDLELEHRRVDMSAGFVNR